jgi:hypothetical protein
MAGIAKESESKEEQISALKEESKEIKEKFKHLLD